MCGNDRQGRWRIDLEVTQVVIGMLVRCRGQELREERVWSQEVVSTLPLAGPCTPRLTVRLNDIVFGWFVQLYLRQLLLYLLSLCRSRWWHCEWCRLVFDRRCLLLVWLWLWLSLS